MRIPNCVFTYDNATHVVEVTYRGARVIQIKLEGSATGTMTRVVPGEDADNYWIGIKPSDAAVFDNQLLGRKSLRINNPLDYEMGDTIDFRKKD